MRRLLERFFSLVLRIFFEKTEVLGEEHVPRVGPLVYVINHPNALVDPLFVFCLAPRRASFLAKEPLFRMPFIGWLVRAAECLPVYRAVDGADTSANRATMEAARRFLAEGRGIALFPEGTSHSDPSLKPLKTGAARLALTANAGDAVAGALVVVPAGIYYSSKQTFRSRALVIFGEPLAIPVVPLDAALEPPREEARALTDRIARALDEVTLRAESAEALAMAEAAGEVFAAARRVEEGEEAGDAVFEEMELRRRLAEGYERLRRERPAEVAAAVRRLEAYRELLRRHGLSPDHPESLAPGPVLAYATRSLLVLLALAPLALPGLVVNYPAYRLIGWLTQRLRYVTDDMISTAKVLGAMLCFPLSWLVASAFVGLRHGALAGALALLVAPLAALSALTCAERIGAFVRGGRALFLFLARPDRHAFLIAERRGIRDDVLALAARLGEG